MKKISILRGPKTKDILGVFTEYLDAQKVAIALFPKIGEDILRDYYIEELELDPLVDKLRLGLLPWWVSIDVVSGDTEAKGDVELLPAAEEVHYLQGKFAHVFVFARDDLSAENRAQELWHEYNKEGQVTALTIFEITFDEHAEIKEVRRFRAVGPSDTGNTINYPAGNIVSFRVVTNDFDEAIETAREMYDEWLDKQIVGEE